MLSEPWQVMAHRDPPSRGRFAGGARKWRRFSPSGTAFPRAGDSVIAETWLSNGIGHFRKKGRFARERKICEIDCRAGRVLVKRDLLGCPHSFGAGRRWYHVPVRAAAGGSVAD